MPQAFGADPPQAVRPDPCRARWRHSVIARDLMVPPQRAGVGRSPCPASSSSTCMVNGFSTIQASCALSSSACTGSPQERCLSEVVDPSSDRFLPARPGSCSSRKISTPSNWRDRSCTGSSRKSRRSRPHACAPPSDRWPSPSGPAGKAVEVPGEQPLVDEPSSHLAGRVHSPDSQKPHPNSGELSSQNYRSCSGPPGGHFD